MGSILAWFREISCLPLHASLDSCVNVYLLGQIWQCIRYVPSFEMADGMYALRVVEFVHQLTGLETRGYNV